MTTTKPDTATKPLQFMVSEEMFEHFGALAAQFAGHGKGAKTAFFLELIAFYERTPKSETARVAELESELRETKVQVEELEVELDRMVRRQNALLDLIAEQSV
ncbi:hypothetical protein K3740_01770 [Ruegeria conchae]|uniref:hypothetical protein n=1 Tax=Ruegeria conchae TaxID=981384 RepID=UPI0021A8AE30|nr:hypothetical protein [Ruegeria conchae]UWR03465.1 hypothetical protein K3740_01770 [Ruegeria conchae]